MRIRCTPTKDLPAAQRVFLDLSKIQWLLRGCRTADDRSLVCSHCDSGRTAIARQISRTPLSSILLFAVTESSGTLWMVGV